METRATMDYEPERPLICRYCLNPYRPHARTKDDQEAQLLGFCCWYDWKAYEKELDHALEGLVS